MAVPIPTAVLLDLIQDGLYTSAMDFLDHIPLTLFFLAVIAIGFFFVEVGFRSAEGGKKEGVPESTAPLATIIAATLGLLALMLGFTFNLAAIRYEDRRTAVLDEANAIATTFLRADYLEPSIRDEVKDHLKRYVRIRADLWELDNGIQEVLTQSEALQQHLWEDAKMCAQKYPNSTAVALFVSSLNEVMNLHTKRVAFGLHVRVPITIWLGLFVVWILSLTGVGYYCGLVGTRRWLSAGILITAFSVVILVIADLDCPRQGLIRTPQQPMIDLANKIKA